MSGREAEGTGALEAAAGWESCSLAACSVLSKRDRLDSAVRCPPARTCLRNSGPSPPAPPPAAWLGRVVLASASAFFRALFTGMWRQQHPPLSGGLPRFTLTGVDGASLQVCCRAARRCLHLLWLAGRPACCTEPAWQLHGSGVVLACLLGVLPLSTAVGLVV